MLCSFTQNYLFLVIISENAVQKTSCCTANFFIITFIFLIESLYFVYCF